MPPPAAKKCADVRVRRAAQYVIASVMPTKPKNAMIAIAFVSPSDVDSGFT